MTMSETISEERLVADIAHLVRAAWNLCDGTANENPPEVDQDDWNCLSAALDRLDGLAPPPGVIAGPVAKVEYALTGICSRHTGKALNWRPRGKFIEFAETAFGEYGIEYYEEDDGCGWEAVYGDSGTLGCFSTKAEAKVAAQADFASRILSTLTTRDVTEQVTEAARRLVSLLVGDGCPSVLLIPEGVDPNEFTDAYANLEAALTGVK